MEIIQKKSFSFKRNVIFRIQGSSFKPNFEMQMWSCRGAAAAAQNDKDRLGLHLEADAVQDHPVVETQLQVADFDCVLVVFHFSGCSRKVS